MSPDRTLLTRLHEPDEVVERAMIEALDAHFGSLPRISIPAEAMLFEQNDPLDSIYILLEGTVKLYQVIDQREVIFHSHTVGKILGLLALTRQSRAFFHCKAIVPLTVLKISFEDLDQAIQHNPTLLVTFITVLLRSMARRSTRLVEVQTEVLSLNKKLSAERDALTRALRELEQAQALLVESEKMATLGQLAAGVAHELNNPVAAISRAADFVHQDLEKLAGELPDGDVFRYMLTSAYEQRAGSTREQRERRKALAEATGDAELAEALVGMGLHTVADYERLSATMHGNTADKLERMNRYHQLGGALRNITRCSTRVADLVKSLRAYSRSDATENHQADVHEGLEDTLLLLSNRLKEMAVERQYGDIPPVRANAGELNQVWTNLIVNALDAMHGTGTLTLHTCREGQQVAVRIIDSGPGIPPENLSKIFNIRFTTRQGRIESGLGLGLSITRNIVQRHGGSIDVVSEPGRTEFCVRLPFYEPDTEPTGTKENK